MKKRYIQIEGQLVEITKDFRQTTHAEAAHNVIADIEPYQSMVTGEMIGGRRQHREHLRQHGLVEIGNETQHLRPWKPEPKIDWGQALHETMARKGLL
jgi:hypothetical protein